MNEIMRCEDTGSADGIAHSIVMVAHLFEQQSDHALRPLGISMRQYMALRTVAESPVNSSRVRLALLLRISPQAMGGLASRLAEAGLLLRTPGAPGASNRYQLTSAGTDRLARGRRILESVELAMIAALPSAAASSIGSALNGLLDSLLQLAEKRHDAEWYKESLHGSMGSLERADHKND